MTLGGALALLSLLLGLAGSDAGQELPTVGRLVTDDNVIVRVPVSPRAGPPNVNWVEGERSKCIKTSAIRGAILSGPDHVDLLLSKGQRVRASFDGRCPAIDFYGDFYLKSEDSRICVRRDSVHSRMGGSCRIEELHRLIPRAD